MLLLLLLLGRPKLTLFVVELLLGLVGVGVGEADDGLEKGNEPQSLMNDGGRWCCCGCLPISWLCCVLLAFGLVVVVMKHDDLFAEEDEYELIMES